MDEKNKQIAEQIANVVATSPAAPVQQVDEDAVAQNIAATGIQAHPAETAEPVTTEIAPGVTQTTTPATLGSKISYKAENPALPLHLQNARGSGEYNASRRDGASPAEQVSHGATISDAGLPYFGGQTIPGAVLKARKPDDPSAFFLKTKFDPVKPYPLTMAGPGGATVMVDSANIGKALYQAASKTEPYSKVSYLGYRPLYEEPTEWASHAFIRGLWNWIPNLLTAPYEAGVLDQLNAEERRARVFDDYATLDLVTKLRKKKLEDFEALHSKYSWEWGDKALGATRNIGANKTGEVLGQLAGQIGSRVVGLGLGALAKMAGATTMMSAAGTAYGYASSVLEAVRDGVDAQVELLNLGMSSRRAHAAGGKAAAWSLGIGMTADMAGDAFMSLAPGIRKGLKLAVEDPKTFNKIVRNRAALGGLFQVGEGVQELVGPLTAWIEAGEPINSETYEDAALVAVLSALVGAAAGALSVAANDPAAKVRAAMDATAKYIQLHEPLLKQIVDASNGVYTWDTLTGVMEQLASGEGPQAIVDYLREQAIANLDKLPEEQRDLIMRRLDEIGTSGALLKEFTILGDRIEKLLAEEGQDLTEDQKNFIRLGIRGVAAMQFLHLGIRPSMITLPSTVQGRLGPAREGTGVAGYTDYNTGGVYVNNALLEQRVDQTPRERTVDPKKYPVGAKTSVKVRNDFSAAVVDKTAQNVAADRSALMGSLMHEFTHWIEQYTGLPGVAQYVERMSKLVDSVLPGYSAGKEGVEKSEAWAYAMQLADKGIKEVLGLAGDDARYIDFMYNVLAAQEAAGDVAKAVGKAHEELRKVMDTNHKMLSDMLDSYGEPALSQAIDNFIETGNPGILTQDNLRALNAILNSASDGETAVALDNLFDSPDAMQRFMYQYGQMMDDLLNKDAQQVAARREATRNEADKKVGLPQKPRVNDNKTVESRMAEVAYEEKPAKPKPATEKQAKPGLELEDWNEIESGLDKKYDLKFSDVAKDSDQITLEGDEPVSPERGRMAPGKHGESYDRDNLLSGKMLADPQYVADYRLKADAWAREWGVSAEDLKGYHLTVTGSSDPKVPSSMKITPSTEITEKDAKIGYAIAAKAAVEKLKALNRFNESQRKQLEENGLYAVVDTYGQIVEPVEFLARRVVNGYATEGELDLYHSLSKLESDLSAIYVDNGPYTPLENAHKALRSVREFLNAASFVTDDPAARRVLFGQYDINVMQQQLHEQIAKALGKDRKTTSVYNAIANYERSLSDYIADEDAKAEIESEYQELSRLYRPDLEETETWEKMPKTVQRAWKTLQREDAPESVKGNAQRVVNEWFTENARSNSAIGRYFAPDYNADYSEHFIGTETLSAAEATEGGDAVLREQNKKANYRNPALGYQNRDIINTPTPLQELGINVEEARAKVVAAGLQPIEFNMEGIDDTYLGRTFNSNEPNPEYLTRRRLLSRLLDQIPSIGESTDVNEQMRVLLAIENAKILTDRIFSEYLGREETFNNNPSLHPITDAMVARLTDARLVQHYMEHRDTRGYSEVASPSKMYVGDEIAFLHGNNIFRGVISFAGVVPSGETFYVIRQALDLDMWKAKDLDSIKRGPQELVVSAQDLRKVPVLRKPETDVKYVTDLFEYIDKVRAHLGWTNYTQLAESSVANTQNQPRERVHMSYSQDAVGEVQNATKVDPARRRQQYMDFGDNVPLYEPTGGLYAVTDEAPLTDPGAFILSDLNEAEASEVFGTNWVDIINQEMEKADAKPNKWKPKFSETYGPKADIDSAEVMLDNLNSALANRKTNKFLIGLGWASGLPRRMRMLFGDVANKYFKLELAASDAEGRAQARRQKFDRAMLEQVHDGSQTKFANWLLRKNVSDIDITLANGQQVKISRGEIFGMAMSTENTRLQLIKDPQGNFVDIEARMRAFYGDETFDNCLKKMTDADWKYVKHVAFQQLNMQRTSETLPAYWIPVQIGEQYIKNGWDARPRHKPDNSLEILASNAPLAAVDPYDATATLIGNAAMKLSGLMDQLTRMKDLLLFADVDRSQFRDFDAADEALFQRLKEKSARLRDTLEKKIGKTFSRWLYESITSELQFNPSLKEIAANPFMRTFQNLNRMKAISVLTGNVRQGAHNLGNYHLGLGLSNSSMAKFYTVDWLNAVAHVGEAVRLTMSIPEFARRWHQAGLSEQMRRAADVNSESFLQELQIKLYEYGKEKPGDLVGLMDTASKIAAKWGMITNVGPDMIGISLAVYAVWEDVLARNKGDIKKAQDEIVQHFLNRVASSNFMTRSAASKMLNKMGLEAFIMFQNDQVQKAGMLAEAIMTLRNSSDEVARKKAWKDIEAFAYSTLRYIAIQAGWLAAIAQLLGGGELSDEEQEYLLDSTMRETLSQIVGSNQFGNLTSQIVTGLWEGKSMGVNILPTSALQSFSTALHKGDYLKAGSELVTDTAFPSANAALRIIDGAARILSDEPHEPAVGALMLLGRSEATAQNMLGLSRSQTTGKLRPKKSETKAQKERRERKREAARQK